MNKKDLINKLGTIEVLTNASRFHRFIKNPYNYFDAIYFRTFKYPKTKESKEVLAQTFFRLKMHLLLPASTDIYITEAKAHESEIRLARLMIKELNEGNTFLDIGAHYGYFSLLASKLVGSNGKVFAFEAAPLTFKILKKNKKNNIEILNNAVSDEKGILSFYEFPNLYSEYNTINVEQFKNEAWIKDYPPNKIDVPTIVLDDFFIENKINADFIKIDVEGAEFKALNGLKHYLSKDSPLIVMEFLNAERGNESHLQAAELLYKLDFKSFEISKTGTLEQIEDISAHLKSKNIDTDNIVFKK